MIATVPLRGPGWTARPTSVAMLKAVSQYSCTLVTLLFVMAIC